jgi:hypothetical protein
MGQDKQPERPSEQRGATEIIGAAAAVVAATPAAIQVGGQIKDKIKPPKQ